LKMSSTKVSMTTRVNSTVRISLTVLSSVNDARGRPTSDDSSSTASGLFESCLSSVTTQPTVGLSAGHISKSQIILPPVSHATRGRLQLSKVAVHPSGGGSVQGRRIASENLGHDTAGNNVFGAASRWSADVRRGHRDAPAPSRLPQYAETDPPPPYSPEFLAPTTFHLGPDVDGRDPLSNPSCRAPPPPFRSSSCAAKLPSRSSESLPGGQRMVPLLLEDDDDDDVFSENSTTTEHKMH